MVDIKVVLDGVCYILMEWFVEDVVLLVKVCDYLWKNVYLVFMVVSGKEEEGVKFCDYFDYYELLFMVFFYCVLAMFCGCNEGVF